MALFSIVFSTVGKVHFSGVLYLSTPNAAQLSCTPTVNLMYQYLTVDGGSSQSSVWTVLPVATYGAVLTNTLNIMMPVAATGQAVFHFDGAFMSGGSAGVLNCRVTQNGGTLKVEPLRNFLHFQFSTPITPSGSDVSYRRRR